MYRQKSRMHKQTLVREVGGWEVETTTLVPLGYATGSPNTTCWINENSWYDQIFKEKQIAINPLDKYNMLKKAYIQLDVSFFIANVPKKFGKGFRRLVDKNLNCQSENHK